MARFRVNEQVKFDYLGYKMRGRIEQVIYVEEAMEEPVYNIRLDDHSKRRMVNSFNQGTAQLSESALSLL